MELSLREEGDNPKNCRNCDADEHAGHNGKIELEVLAPKSDVAGEAPEAQKGKSRPGHHHQPQYHKGDATDDQKPSHLQMERAAHLFHRRREVNGCQVREPAAYRCKETEAQGRWSVRCAAPDRQELNSLTPST